MVSLGDWGSHYPEIGLFETALSSSPPGSAIESANTMARASIEEVVSPLLARPCDMQSRGHLRLTPFSPFAKGYAQERR